MDEAAVGAGGNFTPVNRVPGTILFSILLSRKVALDLVAVRGLSYLAALGFAAACFPC